MLDKDMRGKELTPDDERAIARRRFGREHGDPCIEPRTMTCALWECQIAGECQWAVTLTAAKGE
jgi:hypothetical protein